MVNLILLFTFLGIGMTFAGTILLVFSLPAFFKVEPGGGLYAGVGLNLGPEPPTKRVGVYESIKAPLGIFKSRVIDDKDLCIILALLLLALGSVLQGYGVWLSVTDC